MSEPIGMGVRQRRHATGSPWGGAELVIDSTMDTSASVPADFESSGEPVPTIESAVLESFVKNASGLVFVQIAHATFMVSALWNFVPKLLLVTWYLLVLLLENIRRVGCIRYAADRVKDTRIWLRRLVLLSAANGLIWGGFGLILAPFLAPRYQLLTLIVLMCLVATSTITTPVILPRIFIAFLMPALLPMAIYMLFGTHAQQIAALAILLLLIVLFRFRHLHYRLFETQVAFRAEQQRLHRQSESKRQKETDLLTTKTMLLAGVGHDLMQPVHGMGLLVHELRRSPNTAVLETLANELQRGLDSFNYHLSTILDAARLDSGTYIPERIDLPIQPIIDRVIAETMRKARAKELDLRCRKSSAWVSTDPALAYSIISNLVSNAIRYTERGGIVVGVRRSGEKVRIEIWDSGIGIDEADLPKVFRDFYQVKRSRPTEGTGIGLPLVLRMARLIGCPVSLRSVPGKGSRCAVWLPIAQSHTLKTDWMESPEYFRHKTAIVLDSDATRRERTRNLLSKWGFDIRTTTIDGARSRAGLPPEEPADVLIASMSEQTIESDVGVIESLCARYSARCSVLVIGENSDVDAVARFRAQGFHIFSRPVPPWRLRMILWRLINGR